LNNNKIRLFLVGEGELRQFFEDFIRENSLHDRLFLLGELPREEVFQVILRSDVFVFPSASEAFGLSLLEAMFIGKPVVTSDLACFKEILGAEGIYLPTHSPSAWEDFFGSEFSKRELEPIKKLVLERSKLFTFDKMYKAYSDLL
jgi:glycosyltransferase involved in cell wall biosynthesis